MYRPMAWMCPPQNIDCDVFHMFHTLCCLCSITRRSRDSNEIYTNLRVDHKPPVDGAPMSATPLFFHLGMPRVTRPPAVRSLFIGVHNLHCYLKPCPVRLPLTNHIGTRAYPCISARVFFCPSSHQCETRRVDAEGR